jgi:5-formyltetrahydrofolate cyclo-ligase
MQNLSENFYIKAALRRHLIAERNKMPLALQQQKTAALFHHLQTLPQFIASQHIAGYWPMQGEISPLPILEQALLVKKKWYLPIIKPLKEKSLLFVEYRKDDLLTINRFGVLEPLLKKEAIFPAAKLDLVLVPLVAFDRFGQRLGMGKGYYDYTFAFLRKNTSPTLKKPYLLGLAYDLQETETIPQEGWDIPLNGILTESRYLSL